MMESKRPLSPHLQVYKPQLTSILSITHRASGIALSTGTFFVVGWLVALAGGEKYFDIAHYLASQWYGLIILAGYTWALSYHLCNGIRHLFWDAGYDGKFSDLGMIPAALVLTRVIGRPAGDLICLDLGVKALASEMPPPRAVFLDESGDVVALSEQTHSEEHLVARTASGDGVLWLWLRATVA